MPTREQRRQLANENLKWPVALKSVPRSDWPTSQQKLSEVWRSREYLMQVFSEPNGIIRLTVCRTSIVGDDWKADIPWEDLQRLKRECGRGDRDAVEVFPNDYDVVNVANMRHLWILVYPPSFIWRKQR